MSDAPDRPAPDEVSVELHPAKTVDLIGHASAEAALAEATNGDKLHHAWLLTGPPGIGKATLAYRFARALLAGERGGGLFGDAPMDLQIDPGADVFSQVASGADPNLMVLNRQWDFRGKRYYTIIRVDDVRRLTGFLGQAASREGRRVVLIDAADDLQHPSAENALLKPLEEPPANTVFILISHQPGRLLPTIRSRCRRLDLRPPAPDEAQAIMQRSAPDLGAEEIMTLLALSDQAPGRALRLHEAGGLEIYQALLRLFASLPKVSRDAASKLATQMDSRTDGERHFGLMMDLAEGILRRLIAHRAAGGAGTVLPEEQALFAQLERGGLDQWFDLCDNLQRLRERTETVNLNRKAVTLTLISAFEDAARA